MSFLMYASNILKLLLLHLADDFLFQHTLLCLLYHITIPQDQVLIGFRAGAEPPLLASSASLAMRSRSAISASSLVRDGSLPKSSLTSVGSAGAGFSSSATFFR
jgi:hypothetical protein